MPEEGLFRIPEFGWVLRGNQPDSFSSKEICACGSRENEALALRISHSVTGFGIRPASRRLILRDAPEASAGKGRECR
jgi:hypothetical protein